MRRLSTSSTLSLNVYCEMGWSRLSVLLKRTRTISPLLSYHPHHDPYRFSQPHRIAAKALFCTNAQPFSEKISEPKLGFVVNQLEKLQGDKIEPSTLKENHSEDTQRQGLDDKEESTWSSSSRVQITHPWPEWIELMERLVEGNYFDSVRSSDEDEGDGNSSDVFKDLNNVRNACLNFGRDRFDILRSLSRNDIQVVVGYGCPSLDRKAVNSAKRLRAYVNLDEGDVCSMCNLRGSCDRAYINPREDEGARTVDMMRILLTYGLDPLVGSAENKLHMRKTVKASVRKLLKEVVELSATPLDPNLPKPLFKQPSPRIKQSPPLPRKKVGRDDVEMKKGDWICQKCNFMNFAKNIKCLKCDEKRPRRQLNPGEWECPACNFLNFRRNMACLKCDYRRPKDDDYIRSKDDYMENLRPRRNSNWVDDTERKWKNPVNMANSSKSWNDDFDDDDDESDIDDGEYADHSKTGDDSFCSSVRGRRKDGGISDDSFKFDDFPVRGGKRSSSSRSKANDFQGLGLDEDDDDDDGDGDYSRNKAHDGKASDRYGRPSTSDRGRVKSYDSDGTDDEDGWFGAQQGKGSKISERASFSTPGVKKRYGKYRDLDEDDEDDLFESEDEQPQPSKTKWSEKARSTARRADRIRSRRGREPSSSSRERGRAENDDDFDELDNIDIYEDVEDPFDFEDDTRKGARSREPNGRREGGNRGRNVGARRR